MIWDVDDSMSSLVGWSSGGKMYLISQTLSFVESYKSYEWSQALSRRTSRTSGKSIVQSTKNVVVVSEGPKQSVVESYEWTQALSSRETILSSGKMHLIRWTGAQAISCRVVRVVQVDTSIVESTKNFVKWKNASH